MGSPAFSFNLALDSLECCNCGVMFAAPSSLVDYWRRKHTYFYCPNGHSQHFTAETDAERYKRELDEERARHSRTLTRLNTAERTAKKAERKLKRVARGVCPCCNRSFENLARHMATKHPEQAPKVEGVLPA